MRDVLRNLSQHRALRRLATVLAVIVLLLIGWWATERDAASEPSAVAPTAEPTPGITVKEWAPVQPDVTWHEMADVNMPVSRTAGPHLLTDTRATGFTQDDAGAALAAVHILVRSFPGAGSDSFVPTIEEQITGAGKAQLASRTQSAYDETVRMMDGVDVGQPLPLGQGWIVAYRLVGGAGASSSEARTVQVLVEGDFESLGLTEYTVDLLWQDGDWKAKAPRWGDWGTAARLVGHPYPTSFRSYDEVTLVPEEAS